MDGVFQYLYDPSPVLETVLLLVLGCSIFRPRNMIAIVAALLLIRPNERFDCILSYPKLVFPLLALSLLFFSDKQSRGGQLSRHKPLLLFVAVIVFETAVFHVGELSGIAEFLVLGLLFYFAVNQFSGEPDGAASLSWSLVWSALLISGEAVYYHYFEPAGSDLWRIFHAGHAGRLQAWGNWGNSNETAFLAVIGIVNIAYLFIHRRTKLVVGFAFALIPFFALVVFLTASRAGLATLLIGFLPLVVLLDNKGLKVAVVSALVVTVLMASVISPERQDTEASSSERFDLRYRGIQMFKEAPIFGVGFQRARKDLGGVPLHNTYVQAVVETGLVGAPFFFYFLYGIWRRLYRLVPPARAGRQNLPSLALVAGQYLGALFYFFWGNQLLTVLFFLVTAQTNTWTNLTEQAPALTGAPESDAMQGTVRDTQAPASVA